MNDQLKTFLDYLLHTLTKLRKFGADHYDWFIYAQGQLVAARTIDLIDYEQFKRLTDLLINASAHDCRPFPCVENAGPVMDFLVAHERRKAAAVEAKPPVQATEPVAVGVEPKPAALMLCQDCLHVRPYSEDGHFGDYKCDCGGDFCGCNSCNDFAYGKGDDFVKRYAQDSANEKPEPVPAPTSRRELRLLCVLGKPHLGTVETGYLPIHTMHRLPPRAMVKGKWSQPRYAGLYLRETQAVVPSATVLARCERHRQANAFRATARTIRTGGVIA